MNGTVLVAIGEGVVIGAGYVVAGVPKPYLFAILTAAFAMVPLGAWVVFSAAALLLAAHRRGCVQTFGLIGLFVGPVILAGFWIVARDWVLRPGRQDQS